MTPPIMVTGAPRTGTGYLARVLQAAGVSAGHEAWWGIGARLDRDVDVSWLGCFDDSYTGRVYAQTRNPVDAIPSIYSTLVHPFSLIYRLTVEHSGDWAVDACRVWLAYTRHAVARSEQWWRVEDVTADDLAPLGADPNRVEAALASTPHNVNTRPRQTYSWPDDPIVDACIAYAASLGYEPTDPRT